MDQDVEEVVSKKKKFYRVAPISSESSHPKRDIITVAKNELLKYQNFSYARGYTEEELLDSAFTLCFWRERGQEFPNLKHLARKYLATSATSVPSEEIFSTAGRVLTA